MKMKQMRDDIQTVLERYHEGTWESGWTIVKTLRKLADEWEDSIHDDQSARHD